MRRRTLPEGDYIPRHFRVRILPGESADRNLPYLLDMLNSLQKTGFSASFAERALLDLKMDVKRVGRFVQRVPADAWLVVAGSREVLEWFCEQTVPAYALFGVKSGLPIAGCGVRRDIQPVVRRLVELGHRRIVLLVKEEHIEPEPSLFPRTFLKALEREGVPHGSYNLPAWGYTPKRLHDCLESLLEITSPSALIIDETPIFLAVRDHLARRGIIAPRDVSLISVDHDPSFAWCDPVPSHFRWDFAPISRRVVRWTKNVARGKVDRRQTFTTARFVEGGTVGPAPKTQR